MDTLCDAKFVKLYDLRYQEGKHYLDASRRAKSDLVALSSDEKFRSMLPDAVTIAVVVILPDGKPRLLLNYEFRYPVGQYLLSPIAGLIDPEDRAEAARGVRPYGEGHGQGYRGQSLCIFLAGNDG